jgi:hypothetical protein
MSKYAKLFVALAGAATTGATLMLDGWSASDYFTIAAATLTAVGVGLTPNTE